VDKGAHVAARHPGAFVLSADTIVVAEGRILGKPRDRKEARRMLTLLAGREHRVYTAVCLQCAGRRYRDMATEVTRVRFRALTPPEVAAYVRTGEGDDKAGAYAAQGAGMLLIDRVAGSFTNVVGLPMTRVVGMLGKARLIRVSRRGPYWYSPAGGKG
jgi:septum formation protein